MIKIEKFKKKYNIKIKIRRDELSIPEYLKIENEILGLLSEIRKEAVQNDIRTFISKK